METVTGRDPHHRGTDGPMRPAPVAAADAAGQLADHEQAGEHGRDCSRIREQQRQHGEQAHVRHGGGAVRFLPHPQWNGKARDG